MGGRRTLYSKLPCPCKGKELKTRGNEWMNAGQVWLVHTHIRSLIKQMKWKQLCPMPSPLDYICTVQKAASVERSDEDFGFDTVALSNSACIRDSPKIPLIIGRAIRGLRKKLLVSSPAQPTTGCRGRVSRTGQGLSLWLQTHPPHTRAGEAKSLLLCTHTLQICKLMLHRRTHH